MFHPFGVEQRRTQTLLRRPLVADRLERCADTAEATRRLTALPGIGPWTAAEVVRDAYGDADAVSVGDYHIPNTVAWALAGEPRGTDDRMLELLEPFRGHRGRVCDLLAAGGIGGAPVRPADADPIVRPVLTGGTCPRVSGIRVRAARRTVDRLHPPAIGGRRSQRVTGSGR